MWMPKVHELGMRYSAFLLLVATLVLAQYDPTTASSTPRLVFARGQLPNVSIEQPVLGKRLQDTWQNFLTPNEWKISYITFAHFIPIQLAAIGLQNLYEAVMVSALAHQLASEVPSNVVVITIGNFTLTLRSNEKIPWALLQALAASMWTLSSMGFTSGYTIVFNSPNGTSMTATLSVRGMIRGDTRLMSVSPPERNRDSG